MRIATVLLLSCICCWAGAQGQNSFSVDSTQYLDEVVVTSKYKDVVPAQRLSGADLDRLSSHSVADAIRYFSGVQIKDYGGIGGLKTVDIRSMGTNHLGVFYDGIQLGSAQNGQVDLGRFSLDNIEEVSMYNGQKSEIFQSAKDFGSAGTVYLRTRRPKFEGDKQFNMQAIVRAGSFDLINPSFLWEQKLTDDIAASLNVEYTNASGKYKFRYRNVYENGTIAWDTTATRQNGDINALRLEGGVNGWMKNGKWNVKAYYYDSAKGIPGAIVANVWKHWQRQWDENFFVQGTFQKELTDRYEVLVNAKYAKDYLRYLNPDTQSGRYVDNTFKQEESYLSVANKYSLNTYWDISLSADYQKNYLDANLNEFAYPERQTFLIALASAIEYNKIRALASLLATYVKDEVNKDGLKNPDDKDEYTPAFFISYKPFDKYPVQFRAFYKNIFRMPTFNDLYYSEVLPANLKPEYVTQYNLGIEWDKQDISSVVKRICLKADAYYNEITDKIIAYPEGGQYRWTMMNLEKVEIKGIDLSVNAIFQPIADLSLNTNLSYTYQKAQDFSDKSNKKVWGGQIAYIPWHSGSAVVTALYKTWDLNYSFIYVGERYDSSENIPINHKQPWYTSDFSVGKSFQYKRLAYKLTAEVNNILNQSYDVVQYYPMPGRNYRLILKVNL